MQKVLILGVQGTVPLNEFKGSHICAVKSKQGREFLASLMASLVEHIGDSEIEFIHIQYPDKNG